MQHESTALIDSLQKYYIGGMRINSKSYIIPAHKLAAIIDRLIADSADIDRLRRVIAESNTSISGVPELSQSPGQPPNTSP